MRIDISVANRLAKELSGIKQSLNAFDERFYPEKEEEDEKVASYFLFLVAIDHRTRVKGNYAMKVGEEEFSGSELLFRLAKLKFEDDPEFFTADRMKNISIEEFKGVFMPKGVSLRDPAIRTALLRDLGSKLAALHEGKAINLLEKTKNKIKGTPEDPGIIELLKTFIAYSDPVEKKSFLLIKFLKRRGIFAPEDEENEQVALDNHLLRIAIRTGLLRLDSSWLSLLRRERDSTYEEDTLLRMMARSAFKLVANKAKVSPFVLDDFLWLQGRQICREEKPLCGSCRIKRACLGEGSWFGWAKEPFNDNWYY